MNKLLTILIIFLIQSQAKKYTYVKTQGYKLNSIYKNHFHGQNLQETKKHCNENPKCTGIQRFYAVGKSKLTPVINNDRLSYIKIMNDDNIISWRLLKGFDLKLTDNLKFFDLNNAKKVCISLGKRCQGVDVQYGACGKFQKGFPKIVSWMKQESQEDSGNDTKNFRGPLGYIKK